MAPGKIPGPGHALLPQRPGCRKVRHGGSQEFCASPCLTLPRSQGPVSKAWPGAGIRGRPCLTLAFVLQWQSAFARFVSGTAREPRPALAVPEVRRGHAQLLSARDHGALGVHQVPAWDAVQRRKRKSRSSRIIDSFPQGFSCKSKTWSFKKKHARAMPYVRETEGLQK